MLAHSTHSQEHTNPLHTGVELSTQTKYKHTSSMTNKQTAKDTEKMIQPNKNRSSTANVTQCKLQKCHLHTESKEVDLRNKLPAGQKLVMTPCTEFP
jgi:hypothetical protein